MDSERRNRLRCTTFPVDRIPLSRPEGGGPFRLDLYWLGQAGFLIDARFGTAPLWVRIMIDPYLSDSLAEKYRGKEFPHIRMAPPPLMPDAVQGVDAVFCTHSHSDHLDGGTLPLIASANPSCRFFVPRAILETARERGIPQDRIVTMNAGESTVAASGLRVSAIPSAHERLAVNQRGEHLFLGYALQFDDFTLYHSGDCVPYEGLTAAVSRIKPDLVLLPVNGRDEKRTAKGILGNFTLSEAVDLAEASGAGFFIGHHFGMFDFNTIDPAAGKSFLEERTRPCGTVLFLAERSMRYEFFYEESETLP